MGVRLVPKTSASFRMGLCPGSSWPLLDQACLLLYINLTSRRTYVHRYDFLRCWCCCFGSSKTAPAVPVLVLVSGNWQIPQTMWRLEMRCKKLVESRAKSCKLVETREIFGKTLEIYACKELTGKG